MLWHFSAQLLWNVSKELICFLSKLSSCKWRGWGRKPQGNGLIPVLISSSLLLRAATAENAWILKQLKLERPKFPGEQLTGSRAFPPQVSSSDLAPLRSLAPLAGSSAGVKGALKPAEDVLPVSNFGEIIHLTPILLLQEAVTCAGRMSCFHN